MEVWLYVKSSKKSSYMFPQNVKYSASNFLSFPGAPPPPGLPPPPMGPVRHPPPPPPGMGPHPPGLPQGPPPQVPSIPGGPPPRGPPPRGPPHGESSDASNHWSISDRVCLKRGDHQRNFASLEQSPTNLHQIVSSVRTFIVRNTDLSIVTGNHEYIIHSYW